MRVERLMLKVEYSASVVERVISECNCVFRKRGTPERVMMNAPRDFTEEGLVSGSRLYKPVKSASHQHSRLRVPLGLNTIPLSLVPLR